jgi:hypothetical protein
MGNPYEDFAAKVSVDIAANGLENAYKHFNGAIEVKLSGKTFVEKEAEWTKYSKALENSGALPKLGAEFLIENGSALDRADGKADGIIHRDSLINLAAVTKNPVYKELDHQALKQFDTAAALHYDDGTIDSGELSSFKDRQSMSSRDDFTKSLVEHVFKALEKSPADAAGQLQFVMGARSVKETQPEREETWNAVLAALKKGDANIVAKLSMSWMNNNIDAIDKDRKKDQAVDVTVADLDPFARSRFPMMRTFAQYVKDNFDGIATTDGYSDFDKISLREMQIYQEKMISGH